MTSTFRFSSAEALLNHLRAFLQAYDPKQVFLLCDHHSREHCLPLVGDVLNDAHLICLPAGDEHKNLQSLTEIWQFLSRQGATRKALLLNLGGGMVTDLGGFAAATFKRGIDFVNLPTTLLSCVDAALGGKTGINFDGLKNEIGAFRPAVEVLVYTPFFRTLDRQNLYSGYAEMLKHGLLSGEAHWREVLSLDLTRSDSEAFSQCVYHSMMVKESVVQHDPTEQALRKSLNLGHTIGHAFESHSHHKGNPVAHGYAVAWGLFCELYLSYRLMQFPKEIMTDLMQRIKEWYGVYPISCKDYPYLLEAMHHDKKNTDAHIRFALLSNLGQVHIDQTASEELIKESLDVYRDFMGL